MDKDANLQQRIATGIGTDIVSLTALFTTVYIQAYDLTLQCSEHTPSVLNNL